MKRYNFITMLMVLITCGGSVCIAQVTNEEKANNYYQKALAILKNTTYDALSNALANEALLYVNTAISLNPDVSKYYRVKGTCYYHLKKNGMAMLNYNRAIELDSTNSNAWMARGIIYENTKRYALAEKDYLTALKYNKKSTSIYINLGLLYDKWEKDSLSTLAYEEVIKIDSKNRGAYSRLGNLKLKQKLYSDAIDCFDMAISIDSMDKSSYNTRGFCKYLLKKYEDAIFDFEKALSIQLDDSYRENYNPEYIYNNLANAYLTLGKNDKACSYWNLAIENGYRYKKKWKVLYNLDDPHKLIVKHCKNKNQ